MILPKMILFDYGHTLLCEPESDLLRGNNAVFQYVTSNKNGLTSKQVSDFSQQLFTIIGAARDADLELHEWQFQRFLYEYLEIELSVSLAEAEKVFWDATSHGSIMPNADKMLDYINASGIRSGVISNIGFSGAALSERINRLLPRNKFEFIIASSEYMFRKPHPMLFGLALKKAGLPAGDVWFCGDNIEADIEGATAVGMFPVWYENKTMDNPWPNKYKREYPYGPSCEHLHIHDWLELIDALESKAL